MLPATPPSSRGPGTRGAGRLDSQQETRGGAGRGAGVKESLAALGCSPSTPAPDCHAHETQRPSNSP